MTSTSTGPSPSLGPGGTGGGHDVYAGPAYRQGAVPIGTTRHGAQAVLLAHDGQRARHGVISGEPGAGRTTVLEMAALGLAGSRCWHVLVGDPTEWGVQSRVLAEAADWAAAGPKEVLAQLDALEDVVTAREALLGDAGEMVLRPEVDRPGVVWLVEELAVLVTDPWLTEHLFAHRLVRLLQRGPRVGVGVVVTSQSLQPAYYRLAQLRALLCAGQVIALRHRGALTPVVVPATPGTATGAEVVVAAAELPHGTARIVRDGTEITARITRATDLHRHAWGLDRARLDDATAAAMAPHRTC